MVREGLIDKRAALLRIPPEALEQLLFPRLDPKAHARPLARGLPASPGAASGVAVFDADRAEALGRAGQKVILVREETKPEDIHGFFASQGILTSRGGKTSHGRSFPDVLKRVAFGLLPAGCRQPRRCRQVAARRCWPQKIPGWACRPVGRSRRRRCSGPRRQSTTHRENRNWSRFSRRCRGECRIPARWRARPDLLIRARHE